MKTNIRLNTTPTDLPERRDEIANGTPTIGRTKQATGSANLCCNSIAASIFFSPNWEREISSAVEACSKGCLPSSGAPASDWST